MNTHQARVKLLLALSIILAVIVGILYLVMMRNITNNMQPAVKPLSVEETMRAQVAAMLQNSNATASKQDISAVAAKLTNSKVKADPAAVQAVANQLQQMK